MEPMKPLTLLKSPKSTLLNTAVLLLFLLLPLMVTAQVKRTKKIEADGFVWHYVEGPSDGMNVSISSKDTGEEWVP
jgi:hypothetical protein